MHVAKDDYLLQYSWTPLLVATMGNHVEVVNLLLEHKPNVNALDKDGCTALTIACKEGYHDIAVALLNVGAYINIQVLNSYSYKILIYHLLKFPSYN